MAMYPPLGVDRDPGSFKYRVVVVELVFPSGGSPNPLLLDPPTSIASSCVFPEYSSIPFTVAAGYQTLLMPLKLMTIWPCAFAVAANVSATALFFAPAVAKMSKLVSTCVPLMMTFISR